MELLNSIESLSHGNHIENSIDIDEFLNLGHEIIEDSSNTLEVIIFYISQILSCILILLQWQKHILDSFIQTPVELQDSDSEPTPEVEKVPVQDALKALELLHLFEIQQDDSTFDSLSNLIKWRRNIEAKKVQNKYSGRSLYFLSHPILYQNSHSLSL